MFRIYLSINISIYQYIYLSIYLSINISIYQYIYLSIYLSINLYFYLPTYLSIFQTIYLSRGSTLCCIYILGQPFVQLHNWVDLMSTLGTVLTLRHTYVWGRPYVGSAFYQVGLLSVDILSLKQRQYDIFDISKYFHNV